MPSVQMQHFRILTVGFPPWYVRYFFEPIAQRTGFVFTHALVGDARQLPEVRRDFPGINWITLSKAADAPLPEVDQDFLTSLEAVGVPTLRTAIRGDRVLRHRNPDQTLAYATLLGRGIGDAIEATQPDVVIGNFDNLHSALGLAVSKSKGVPWVAMAFSVIPEHLMGFCKGMAPDNLAPILRPVTDEIRAQAVQTMQAFRARSVRVMAYRPPESLGQKAAQVQQYARNFVRRFTHRRRLAIDEFTFPSTAERVADVARRALNALQLPEGIMLGAPPRRRFAYFPMQMAPESSIDTWAPMYENQLALVSQVALALPVDLDLVVKLHFSDPDNYTRAQLLDLTRLPRVHIAHPRAPGRAFLDQATLVVGIQGTSCLEAALLGKPVLMYGESPYLRFPRTERALAPDAVFGQIQRMLRQAPPSDEEIVEAFAAYIARYMPARMNDWSRPIADPDHDRFARCFEALRDHLAQPGVPERWYSEQPFDGEDVDAGALDARGVVNR